jgi:iron complex transport system substrate-binding protein
MRHLFAPRAIYIVAIAVIAYSFLLRTQSVTACERIIPLSPSTTEVVFDLGLGARVVATSSYTSYPKEATRLPHVGGLIDPNIEQILLLRPSLVILLNSQMSLQTLLERADIKTLIVDHNSLDGLKRSYQLIGQHCAIVPESTDALKRLNNGLDLVKKSYTFTPKTRVLLVVGSLIRSGDLSSLYLSGNDGIYTSLLEYLGAKNIIGSKTSIFGNISPETMRILNPDYIIQIAPEGTDITQQNVYWRSLENFLFGKQIHNLLILNHDYASIPGPRLPLLLRDMAQFLSHNGSSR